MKWQLNTYLYLFHGYTPSWVFSFIVFFIHDSIVSYPSALLEGSSLDGKSLIFSCSHLLFSSFFFLWVLFLESIESNHFLLAHIPRMNESYDPGRPFKMAITTSAFFTSSFTTSSCSLIWETLMTVWSLHSGSSHSSTGCSKSSSGLCSSLQISLSGNQTLL